MDLVDLDRRSVGSLRCEPLISEPHRASSLTVFLSFFHLKFDFLSLEIASCLDVSVIVPSYVILAT